MKKWFLALAILITAAPAWAQNLQCPTRPTADSTNACASTAFVKNVFASGSYIPLTTNYFLIGNASNLAQGVPMTGDCAISFLAGNGQIICTKTNGVAFGAMATLTATAAGDLSGTWPTITVAKVQGLAWQATTYTNSQVPVWSAANSRFEPGTPVTSVPIYDTTSAVISASVPASNLTIYIRGYSTAGDRGGGWWVRSASVPSHTAYIQSADGAYWSPSLANNQFAIEIFGGQCGSSSFDNTAALNRYNSFIQVVGTQKLLFGACSYYFNTQPNAFAGNPPYLEGVNNNYSYVVKNFNAVVGEGFIRMSGATGAVLKNFVLYGASGTSNGYMLLFAATASDGSGNSIIENVIIAAGGNNVYERGIYVNGSAKTTGAVGSRDHMWRNFYVAGASATSVYLLDINGLSWFGGAVYSANGTGAESGEITIEGTGPNSASITISIEQAAGINLDEVTYCVIRATTIQGSVINTANTNRCSVGGYVTGTSQTNWLNGNYTVN